jgi:hypothetical protein
VPNLRHPRGPGRDSRGTEDQPFQPRPASGSYEIKPINLTSAARQFKIKPLSHSQPTTVRVEKVERVATLQKFVLRVADTT